MKNVHYMAVTYWYDDPEGAVELLRRGVKHYEVPQDISIIKRTPARTKTLKRWLEEDK